MVSPDSMYSRRGFLTGLSAAALLADGRLGAAWSGEISKRLMRGTTVILDHDEAVAEGLRRDIGSVEVLLPQGSREVQAAGIATFSFKYRVGKTPIIPGGFVWFAMRHLAQCSNAQIKAPDKPGFTTVSAPAGVQLEIVPYLGRPDKEDLFLKAFPWQNPIEVRVKTGTLNPGDEIILTYGDQSKGGPGVQMQAFQERGFAFRIYVASGPDQPFLPLAEDIGFPIVGGPVDHLRLIAPSSAKPGSPIKLRIRAEDKYSNQASGYSGELVLTSESGEAISRLQIASSQRGLAAVDVRELDSDTGVVRFSVSDGTRTAVSNPVKIAKEDTGNRTFFGEIHGHTTFSDGRGTPQQYFEYARDVSAVDFCALTEHDYMLSDEAWSEIQKTVEAANAPGEFVTIQAYEWSGLTDVGGDHNVYFRGTDTKLFRCRSYYDYRNQQTYHGAEPQMNHIEDLYNALLSHFPEGQVMVVPHYGGRPANPKWHNGRLERMIEIYSEHKQSNEWAYEFMRRKYRLGIIAGGDDHIGRPGNGFIFNPLLGKPVEIGAGLIAVIAPELTREAIFDAMFARHAYATTGERMLLQFTAGSAMMGDEIESPDAPEFTAAAEGTAPISNIEIWKDVAIVRSQSVNQKSATLSFTDPNPPSPGQTSMYWLRVQQENGEEAISSPIWWTRT